MAVDPARVGALLEINNAVVAHLGRAELARAVCETLARVLPGEEVERRHIADVLAQARWRIEGEHGAAKLLGLHPSTLRSRIKKLGITRG